MLHVVRYLRWGAVAGLVASAGCGGAQIAGGPPPVNGSLAPQAVRLVITVDGTQTQSSKRTPRYVSPATQSLSVNVTLQGGTTSIAGFPQTVNLTSTSNGCVSTLASTQCTLTINVPPGSFDATLTTYDGANATGNVLSAAQSVPFVVTAGAANRLAIILGGVPTSARIIADSPTITGDPSTGFTLAGRQRPGDGRGRRCGRQFHPWRRRTVGDADQHRYHAIYGLPARRPLRRIVSPSRTSPARSPTPR